MTTIGQRRQEPQIAARDGVGRGDPVPPRRGAGTPRSHPTTGSVAPTPTRRSRSSPTTGSRSRMCCGIGRAVPGSPPTSPPGSSPSMSGGRRTSHAAGRRRWLSSRKSGRREAAADAELEAKGLAVIPEKSSIGYSSAEEALEAMRERAAARKAAALAEANPAGGGHKTPEEALAARAGGEKVSEEGGGVTGSVGAGHPYHLRRSGPRCRGCRGSWGFRGTRRSGRNGSAPGSR